MVHFLSLLVGIIAIIFYLVCFIILVLICIALPLYILLCVIYGYRFTQKLEDFFARTSLVFSTSNAVSWRKLRKFSEIKIQLDELSQRAWKTDKISHYPQFSLKSKRLSKINKPEKAIEVYLNHAREVAPGFSIPHMIPRVTIGGVPSIPGQFKVDRDGWVTISLNRNFSEDKSAAKAILAHELCHYILENSGIRHKNSELNERYTDLCMFICGFGELFLEGYKRYSTQYNNHSGYRLGYLTDAEYKFARQYVSFLRQSKIKSNPANPGKELETLRRRLSCLLYHDNDALNSLIHGERQRNPHKPPEEWYRDAIYRLERDRRH